MIRSTLFALAISAFAAMTLAAPNNAKRRDDDGHNNDDDSILQINDLGILANLDEVGKNADLLNGLDLLSSGGKDHDHH